MAALQARLQGPGFGLKDLGVGFRVYLTALMAALQARLQGPGRPWHRRPATR